MVVAPFEIGNAELPAEAKSYRLRQARFWLRVEP